MNIRKIKITKPFKYLWLKKIVGVDLSVHCAKSLLGEYSKALTNRTKEAENIELDGDIYYLCGVSLPYVWENNFHLAFRWKENSVLQFSDKGIDIEIDGAERIEFSQKDVDNSLPQSKKKEFYTCRNWQFACLAKREIFTE